MHILIVGNVLKDIYLSLDERTESFETDNSGISWLNLSFDTSTHHFFRRTSNFAGAAVTMEVLEHLGIKATISHSDFSMNDNTNPSPSASTYRYILTDGSGATYLTPTAPGHAQFDTPADTPDYVFVDRSANLDEPTAKKLASYLDSHPYVGLILYLRDAPSPTRSFLLPYANLVFAENTKPDIPLLSDRELSQIDSSKIITITENRLIYQEIIEPISVAKIDAFTHLSVFSIAAATILGGFLLGKSVEDSLRLARANVENSRLDASLSLAELENLAAILSDDPELLAAAYITAKNGTPSSLIAATPSKPTVKSLTKLYQDGIRFVRYTSSITTEDLAPDPTTISRTAATAARFTKSCLLANIAPIISVALPTRQPISITKCAELTSSFLEFFFSYTNSARLNSHAILLELPLISTISAESDSSTSSEITQATTEVLRRFIPSDIAGIIITPTTPAQKEAASYLLQDAKDGYFPFPISLPLPLLQA